MKKAYEDIMYMLTSQQYFSKKDRALIKTFINDLVKQIGGKLK